MKVKRNIFLFSCDSFVFFCSKKLDPLGDLDEKRAAKLQGLKYYSPEIHRAAYALPRFARDFLPLRWMLYLFKAVFSSRRLRSERSTQIRSTKSEFRNETQWSKSQWPKLPLRRVLSPLIDCDIGTFGYGICFRFRVYLTEVSAWKRRFFSTLPHWNIKRR